jgi:glycosyltransferase involved in cell wall biosynthesis
MRLSIITPSLNNAVYLPQALDSILSQEGNFELESLIMDGGSNDGSVDFLRGFGPIPSPTPGSEGIKNEMRWISEPDNGQAAAINKGLAMATGEIIGWLNADDLYQAGALATVAETFAANPNLQWLIGRCDIIDENGQTARSSITDYKNRLLDSYSRKSLLRMNIISQPAVFWRREFGRQIGPLDESLHWTMDYDLWLRMAEKSEPMILKETLAQFRVRGDSKSQGGRRGQFAEGYQVACRYCNEDWMSRLVHRVNVEKIVWGYTAMRWMGR